MIPPGSGSGTFGGTAGTLTYHYVITSIDADTGEESPASTTIDVASVADEGPTAVAPIVLTWTAEPTAASYMIYCDPAGNGIFGYIGSTPLLTYNHTTEIPDYALTPPEPRILFRRAERLPGVFVRASAAPLLRQHQPHARRRLGIEGSAIRRTTPSRRRCRTMMRSRSRSPATTSTPCAGC